MVRYSTVMDQIDLSDVKHILAECPAELVGHEELLFQQKITNACDLITQQHAHIILVTGPSASGKTTSAKMITNELKARGKQVDRISLDNFYRPTSQLPRWEDGYQNYESVDGLDIPCFEAFLEHLFRDGHSLLPVFDFATGKRAEKTIDIGFDEHTYLIFEGIHALNPKVTQPLEGHAAMKIYISTHSDFIDSDGSILLTARDLRLTRRILRDFWYRSTTAEETFRMWYYVLKGEDLYIRPFRQYADLHINSTHSYEPFLYHDALVQTLERTSPDSPYRDTIRHLLESARHFFGIDSDLIPKTSLIQEFIRH